ncbi:hypothetical protein B0J18DRAFT_439427 [Chaetomium sp. MPI-SDFR-AT-0129]|nr:hypothetical protein B0J18DRAFT_439427 [Chaetomium sp. MPI-SDFR-AT-0129]
MVWFLGLTLTPSTDAKLKLIPSWLGCCSGLGPRVQVAVPVKVKSRSTLPYSWCPSRPGVLCDHPMFRVSLAYETLTRQARILAGQDIFGHDPSWVPRLSTKVYAQRADKLLAALKEVEEMTSGYQEAVKNDGKVEQYLKSSLKAGKDNEERLKSLIDSQCGPDGAISAAAAQVTKFAQLQSEKREEIKGPLDRVKDEIGRACQIDFWKVFEGLSNLLGPPSFKDVVSGGANIGKIAWDAYKTVHDATGATFDKADIIEQLATCSDTLKSLEEAVTMNDDDKINLQDPGGLKIIASVNNIKSLVK